MPFNTPEGAFGWGFPDWSRPRVEIVDRIVDPTPGRPAGIRQRALVDVEVGKGPFLRMRLEVACVSTDSAAIIRGLAFQKFAEEMLDAAAHVDGLADEAQLREPEQVWRGALMELTTAAYVG